MIEIDIRKLERGTRTGTVTVRRGGKIFQRKQRLGQKEKEDEDDKRMSSMSPIHDTFPNVGDTITVNGKQKVIEAVNKPENSVRIVGGGWHDWDRLNSGRVYKKPKPKPKPKPQPKTKPKPAPVRDFPKAKEYKTIIDRTTKKFERIVDKSGKTFIGKIWEFIGHTKGVETLNPKWGKDTQLLRDGLDNLNDLLGDNYDIDVSIEALPWGARSFERGDKSVHINVNSESRNRSLFHEIGHVLEKQKENSDAASWFKQSRTKGETPCKLCDLLPRAGYGEDEITVKDNFFDPYIGKIYDKDPMTEVISMGLERFAEGSDRAQSFYNRDTEHFMFLLAIMSGEFIKGAKK